MKQTGKLYLYETVNDRKVVSPIAHAFLYFLDVKQADKTKWSLVAETNENGDFNFDLPIGEYVVSGSAGNNIIQEFANSTTFVLSASSNEKSFEKWVNEPNFDGDSSLLAKFREMMLKTEEAAERGENASQIVDENLEENLQKLTDRTNVGLSALTDEKNSSISEINTVKDNSLVELKTATDKAEGSLFELKITTSEAENSLSELKATTDKASKIKQDIDSAETSAVASVNSAKTSGVSAVNLAKTESLIAITDAEFRAMSEVNTTKENAIKEVEEKVPGFAADLERKWDVQETIGTGAVIRESGAFGVEQRWYTSSALGGRKPNITYTNTTSKPIIVSVVVTQSTGLSGNVLWAGSAQTRAQVPQSDSVPMAVPLQMIVPPGEPYGVNGENAWMWMEFR